MLAAAPVNSAAQAEALRRLAWIDYRLGNFDAALTGLQNAQSKFRALYGSRSFELARTLNSLGVVQRDRGDYAAALGNLQAALAMLDQQLPRDADQSAVVHNNLAGLFYYRSDFRQAMQEYRLALELFERLHGDVHADVAGALNNVGLMYKELGAQREALTYLERALAIKEKLLGPNHPSTGNTLNNLAEVSAALGDSQTAAQRFDRALAIFEQALGAQHPNVAHVLASRGEFRSARGDPVRAKADLQRALAIREQAFGLNSNWAAETLVILGPVEATLGEATQAQATALRALSLAVVADETSLLCNAYAAYARVLDVAGAPSAAAFYGKRAVNLIQGMRTEVAKLGESLQQSFLVQRQQIYRDLIERLVALGRLSEAEQILRMLKEEEYFDYVRNAVRTADGGSTRAQFSRREQPLATRLDSFERSTLTAVSADRAKSESAQTVPTSAGATTALNRLTAEFRGLSAELGTQKSVAASDIEPTPAPADGIAQLQYFVSGKSLRILVRTASTHSAIQRNVDQRTLNRRIFEFRQHLQDARSKPLPLAKALHDDLLEPVRELLVREKIHTLNLTLDGTLRYVPFAALYDGKQFVVERYGIQVRTPASTARASSNRSVNASDRIAAFGVSREVSGLPALPRVRTELERIVRRDASDRDGVFPGTLSIDQAFTQQRLEAAFAEHYPLLHLATHFVFQPGGLADSYLVLGDGAKFSLERLQSAAPDLSSTRLLTLSACSSALGDDAGAGRELESFGTLALRLGVGEVMASLWPVTDGSTSVLMTSMYRTKAQQRADTPEALRQAQLSLLAKHSPWKHPTYWAPFVVFSADDGA